MTAGRLPPRQHRRGARALGLDHTVESLGLAKRPAAFQRLGPHEVEDCLCLYQDELEAIDARCGRARSKRTSFLMKEDPCLGLSVSCSC
jgi:hypothetical protein